MQQDLQHIRLLSIFYYVVAGMLALISCLPLIYLVIGIVIIVSPSSMGPGGPPAAIGWVFVLFASIATLLGWGTAVCLVIAGWHLGRCRHYVFCMVMAALACLFHPFGTVLGIFTFVVLLRPSVKQLFEAGGVPSGTEESEEGDEDPLERIVRSREDVRTQSGLS